jgi:hypothetical protein
MKKILNNWYFYGLVPAAVALAVLIVRWSAMPVLSRVSLINFIGLLLHQAEEYGWPGGAPCFMNKYMRGGDERYPLNQLSAMIVNVTLVYVCYLLPVFLPDVMWLGLAPILFGCVFQVLLHGVVFMVKFHHFYNSGIAAVLCIHVPCGIYYIWYAVSHSMLSGSDWLFGVLYLLGMIAFTGLAGQVVFSSRDSRFPFNEREIAQGEKFARRMGV